MTESTNAKDLFDMLARILLRCFVLGYLLLLLLWFVLYVVASGMLYWQAKLFGLTPHEVDLIHYCGMAVVKLIVILFFLFPYLTIRLVSRKRS
jgi:hypothetical protein